MFLGAPFTSLVLVIVLLVQTSYVKCNIDPFTPGVLGQQLREHYDGVDVLVIFDPYPASKCATLMENGGKYMNALSESLLKLNLKPRFALVSLFESEDDLDFQEGFDHINEFFESKSYCNEVQRNGDLMHSILAEVHAHAHCNIRESILHIDQMDLTHVNWNRSAFKLIVVHTYLNQMKSWFYNFDNISRVLSERKSNLNASLLAGYTDEEILKDFHTVIKSNTIDMSQTFDENDVHVIFNIDKERSCLDIPKVGTQTNSCLNVAEIILGTILTPEQAKLTKDVLKDQAKIRDSETLNSSLASRAYKLNIGVLVIKNSDIPTWVKQRELLEGTLASIMQLAVTRAINGSHKKGGPRAPKPFVELSDLDSRSILDYLNRTLDPSDYNFSVSSTGSSNEIGIAEQIGDAIMTQRTYAQGVDLYEGIGIEILTTLSRDFILQLDRYDVSELYSERAAFVNHHSMFEILEAEGHKERIYYRIMPLIYYSEMNLTRALYKPEQKTTCPVFGILMYADFTPSLYSNHTPIPRIRYRYYPDVCDESNLHPRVSKSGLWRNNTHKTRLTHIKKRLLAYTTAMLVTSEKELIDQIIEFHKGIIEPESELYESISAKWYTNEGLVPWDQEEDSSQILSGWTKPFNVSLTPVGIDSYQTESMRKRFSRSLQQFKHLKTKDIIKEELEIDYDNPLIHDNPLTDESQNTIEVNVPDKIDKSVIMNYMDENIHSLLQQDHIHPSIINKIQPMPSWESVIAGRERTLGLARPRGKLKSMALFGVPRKIFISSATFGLLGLITIFFTMYKIFKIPKRTAQRQRYASDQVSEEPSHDTGLDRDSYWMCTNPTYVPR